MKKIVFFTRRFYPFIGGVEKHCLEVASRLVKLGYTLSVVTERPPQESKLKLEETLKGITIIRIPISVGEKLKKFQIWKWLLKNKKLISQCDIVHCHDVFFWYLPFILINPFKKVFVTFHGYEGNNLPSLNQIIQHKVGEIFSKGSICVGDFHKKWYFARPNYISYGATNVKKKQVFHKRFMYDFCYVGRLSSDVGIINYLEALKLLKEKGLIFKIVVCGDGPLRKKAEEVAIKSGIEAEFLGL